MAPKPEEDWLGTRRRGLAQVGEASFPTAQLCSRPNSVPSSEGLREPQSCNPRASSLSASAGTVFWPPGSPGCAARHVARVARVAGMHPALCPRSNPFSSAGPTAGRAESRSRRSGHPGYCSGPAAARDLREKWPSPNTAGSATGRDGRLGADGELARTEKSCSEGRRRWVVGGGGGWGRRSPSYLQSRKYSAAQLTEPGDEAASAASRAPVCASAASRDTERPPSCRSLRAGTSAPRGWARRLRPGLATRRRRTRPWALAFVSA